MDIWISLLWLLNLKWVYYFFTTNNAMSSLMRSYKLEDWEFSNAKLRVLSLISIGFRNVYAQTRNGNNAYLCYSLAFWRAFSLPTYWMTNPTPCNEGFKSLPADCKLCKIEKKTQMKIKVVEFIRLVFAYIIIRFQGQHQSLESQWN